MKNFLIFLFAFIIISISAKSVEREPLFLTTITGSDEAEKADVKDVLGDKRLFVDAYISDSVEIGVIPGSISDRFMEFFKNAGSSDMRVDGSGTPVVFAIPVHSTKITLISQLRCFGGGPSIKLDKFLTMTAALTNGLKVDIKSEGITTTFVQTIKTTADFKNIFAFPNINSFELTSAPSGDEILAIYIPLVPFPIKNSTSDFVNITVQDDIDGPSSSLTKLSCIAEGFYR